MNKFISFFIFISIFSIVFFGAFLSIRYGLNNNSNFSEISNLTTRISKSNQSGRIVLAETTNLPQNEPLQDNKCPRTIENINTNSIVDLLYNLGLDYTYNNRVKLALESGIPEYRGTADQNLKIISTIKKGDLCLISKIN